MFLSTKLYNDSQFDIKAHSEAAPPVYGPIHGALRTYRSVTNHPVADWMIHTCHGVRPPRASKIFLGRAQTTCGSVKHCQSNSLSRDLRRTVRYTVPQVVLPGGRRAQPGPSSSLAEPVGEPPGVCASTVVRRIPKRGSSVAESVSARLTWGHRYLWCDLTEAPCRSGGPHHDARDSMVCDRERRRSCLSR
eukprot:761032-Hanusia_phi.AAC.13